MRHHRPFPAVSEGIQGEPGRRGGHLTRHDSGEVGIQPATGPVGDHRSRTPPPSPRRPPDTAATAPIRTNRPRPPRRVRRHRTPPTFELPLRPGRSPGCPAPSADNQPGASNTLPAVFAADDRARVRQSRFLHPNRVIGAAHAIVDDEFRDIGIAVGMQAQRSARLPWDSTRTPRPDADVQASARFRRPRHRGAGATNAHSFLEPHQVEGGSPAPRPGNDGRHCAPTLTVRLEAIRAFFRPRCSPGRRHVRPNPEQRVNRKRTNERFPPLGLRRGKSKLTGRAGSPYRLAVVGAGAPECAQGRDDGSLPSNVEGRGFNQGRSLMAATSKKKVESVADVAAEGGPVEQQAQR